MFAAAGHRLFIAEVARSQVANLYGFSSLKKMASVLMSTPDGYRLYNKVPSFVLLV